MGVSNSTPLQDIRSRFAVPAAFALGFALMGCEPIRQTHGYIPAQTYVEQIKIGEDSRADIVSKIGRPSTTAAFENDEWYYITRSTVTRAFFAPKVVDQNVMVLAFNDDGVVESLDRYVLEDGQFVDLVTRTTPTRGKRLTFLQQLIGNLGKFTPGQVFGDDPLF